MIDSERKIERVVCITSTFPTASRFWRGTFVENFCVELQRLGVDITAVVPQGLHAGVEDFFRRLLRGNSGNRKPIKTRIAGYPSFSVLSRKHRMFSVMNRALCKRSTERTLDRISPKPDLIYAHFLMSGLLVGDWCRRNQVELAVISGESEYDSFLRWIDRASLVEKIRRFDHLFFVSERNRTALAQYLGLEGEIGRVLANAVDTKTFRPLPKVECRRKLGLPENATIAVFVGYFIERKGPLRVLQALESVDDVYCVFIGKGSQVPKGDRVLFAGSVPNYEMPEWLSAADFFVLPSLNEGRSNAVLEALACGLPLIVSDRDFNREFLDENCAVFIDPNSVGDIANAILELARNPERRAKMGDSGRRHSLNFSQRQRALRFLEVVSGGKIVKKPG